MKKPSNHPLPLRLLPFSIAALLLVACKPGPQSPLGFRLPDGDLERGKTAFVQLQCHHCHRVSGIELPPPPEASRIDIPLGGEIYQVKTYGELVTSIINPRHIVSEKWEFMKDADGRSIMPDHNDKMTVTQMIDLVAFLHSRYQLLEPYYPEFGGP